MRKSVSALAVAATALAALVALRWGGDGTATGAFATTLLPPVPEAHFVSPAKQDVETFELVGNSRGDAMLVWREYAAFGHMRLWVRSKRAGGSFGRPHALSGVHVSAIEPNAAVGEDGTQLVTWTDLHRYRTSLKVAARRADGSFSERTFSSGNKPAFTINPGTAWDLAIAADGTALLVGFGSGNGAGQVVAAARSRNGHWGEPQVVTSGKRGVRYPTVAFDGAGNATLAWERGRREFPDDAAERVKQELRVAVRPKGGRFGKPRRVSKRTEDARDAALAVNARGDAALMWNATHGRNGSGSRIGVALRSAGGGFGPPRLITPPGEAGAPSPAIGPAGEVVAVWSEDRMTKDGFGCGCPRLVRARGSVGDGLGASRALSSRTAEVWHVAGDPNGNVFAMWLRSSRGIEDAVEGRFAGVDGSIGPLVRVDPRGYHDNPQALLYPDGTALAAWVRLRGPEGGRIEAVRARVRP